MQGFVAQQKKKNLSRKWKGILSKPYQAFKATVFDIGTGGAYILNKPYQAFKAW